MEADSVHSTVESACRFQSIYVPTDYYSIVKLARRSNLYEVTVMETQMFYDYKDLSHAVLHNKTRSTDGAVVRWLKIKWLKYEKQNPQRIFFKYDYHSDFQVMDVSPKRRGRRALPQNTPKLKKLYSESPKVSAAKLNDLMALCTDHAIPADYHPFYAALKSDASVVDTLPEPDVAYVTMKLISMNDCIADYIVFYDDFLALFSNRMLLWL